MEFEKVSEQNAWNTVAQATAAMRQEDMPHADLAGWLQHQGIDLKRSIFPTVRLFDDNVFSGTLVSQSRRVIEYFIDTSAPEHGEFDDVTEALGPKDPAHPDSDVRDLITMALVFFDNQHGIGA